MKKLLLLLHFAFYIFNLQAQNVGIGTTTPQAKLHIKGSADTSQLVIDANSTQSNLRPLIRLRNAAGADLMHIHSDAEFNVFMGINAGRVNASNITTQEGLFNTFIGSNAGYYNTTGQRNTAMGRAALFQNINGSRLTAIGFRSLFSTVSAVDNTAVGNEALFSNIYGNNNTAMGSSALKFNGNGSFNTAFGLSAIESNTTGQFNTAFGAFALFTQSFSNGGTTWSTFNTALGNFALTNTQSTSTTNGISNTAVGHNAMSTNTTGAYNTAVGQQSLQGLTIGDNNIGIGFNSGAVSNGNNNTVIGTDALVNGGSNNVVVGYNAYTDGNNVAQLGNTITAACGGYTNWFNFVSDRRLKTEINEDVRGLDFIMRLRPVTYHVDVRGTYTLQGISAYGRNNTRITPEMKAQIDDAIHSKETQRMSGFIAQEVEKAALETNYDFDGIKKPANDKDNYGLAYASFVVPLVKAVQEQQATIKDQQQQIDNLKKEKINQQKEVEELKTRLDNLEKLMMNK